MFLKWVSVTSRKFHKTLEICFGKIWKKKKKNSWKSAKLHWLTFLDGEFLCLKCDQVLYFYLFILKVTCLKTLTVLVFMAGLWPAQAALWQFGTFLTVTLTFLLYGKFLLQFIKSLHRPQGSRRHVDKSAVPDCAIPVHSAITHGQSLCLPYLQVATKWPHSAPTSIRLLIYIWLYCLLYEGDVRLQGLMNPVHLLLSMLLGELAFHMIWCDHRQTQSIFSDVFFKVVNPAVRAVMCLAWSVFVSHHIFQSTFTWTTIAGGDTHTHLCTTLCWSLCLLL